MTFLIERQQAQPHRSHHRFKARPHVQLPTQVRRVVPHPMGVQPHPRRNVRNVPAQCQVTQHLEIPRSEGPTGTSLFYLLAKYSRRGLLFDRQTADTIEH